MLLKKLLNLGAWRARELPELPYELWREQKVIHRQLTALGRVWTLGTVGMRALGFSSKDTLSPDASLQYLYRRRLHRAMLEQGYAFDVQLGKAILVYRRDGDMHYAIGSVWGYKAASIRGWLKRLSHERASGVQLIIAHPRPKRLMHYEDKKGVHLLPLCIGGESDTQPEDPKTHSMLAWRVVDGREVPLRRKVDRRILERV